VKPFLLQSQPDRLAELMLQGLPWTPHDFIAGVSSSGDRSVQFEPLRRDIDPRDDMRIAVSLPGGPELAFCAERLPWDSAFFGYEVAKLHGVYPLPPGIFRLAADYGPAVTAFVGFARARGIRYLFAAIDARDLPTIRALSSAGFAVIETRCYYHRSLHDFDSGRRFRCRLATASDVESVSAIARRSVNAYDRFHADPYINPGDADRLMESWVRASILGGFADAVFIPDRPPADAVAAVRFHRDKWLMWGTSIAQLTFGAGFPRGSNSFGMVFSEVNQLLKESGVAHCFLGTQIANQPIIRTMEHFGYRLGRGEHVLRLLL
jgi:hypothetical protein